MCYNLDKRKEKVGISMTADMPPAYEWRIEDDGWESASKFKVSSTKINECEKSLRATYRFNNTFSMSYLHTGNEHKWTRGFELTASYNLSPVLSFRGNAFHGKDETEQKISGGGIELVLLF